MMPRVQAMCDFSWHRCSFIAAAICQIRQWTPGNAFLTPLVTVCIWCRVVSYVISFFSSHNCRTLFRQQPQDYPSHQMNCLSCSTKQARTHFFVPTQPTLPVFRSFCLTGRLTKSRRSWKTLLRALVTSLNRSWYDVLQLCKTELVHLSFRYKFLLRF